MLCKKKTTFYHEKRQKILKSAQTFKLMPMKMKGEKWKKGKFKHKMSLSNVECYVVYIYIFQLVDAG